MKGIYHPALCELRKPPNREWGRELEYGTHPKSISAYPSSAIQKLPRLWRGRQWCRGGQDEIPGSQVDSSFKFITTPTRHDACIGHVITSRKRNFPGTCNNINTSNLVPAGDSTPLSPIARSRPERTQRICVMSCRREQIDRCTSTRSA